MARTTHPDRSRAPWSGIAAGVVLGTLYGVLARWIAQHGLALEMMSVAFLFAVPVAMGVLSVLPVRAPTLLHALALPLLSSTATLAVAIAVGWEGLICVAMILVPLMLLALLGGLIVWLVTTWVESRRRDRGTWGLLLLPLFVAQLERGIQAPVETRTVASSIVISAGPGEVWEQIVEVPAIREDERRPALFTAIGFPRPISATLDSRELGGVRQARFEGGLLFLEEITRFEPGRVLEFTIDAQEHLIPPTTLDPHVTIGGPYFDVLTGAYEIESRGSEVVLHLTSRLRVSTRFNLYAGFWADLVMQSIQEHILEIVKARAEAGAAR